ncbi:MAG: isocitrate lyase/phosphoenolpyruvate mutase family protein [Planctomycetes bacterium]|nr:isocitrate lyase/phosphoenolpyruvate mutase family protein [Planctomycetota bacterium]
MSTSGPATLRKTTALRRRLAESRPLLVGGAHNGLSGKLVQEAGFDAIWASGFEISASFGVPDANILTMAENLEAARAMNTATTLPVIADCDTGYGNAVNVIRTVQEYEASGIAAICIEDNVFPKRCSFYSEVKRELVSSEEHAGKIRAAKSAQRDPDFLVIARTEALNAGWSMEDALARANAYADAGADAILIHSKAKTPDEVLEFASRWKRPVPLVAVPTTYKGVSASRLAEAGFRIVIYANHGLRAAIRGMQSALRTIREKAQADAADDRIVPLEEVYRLVGVPELQRDEKTFLPVGAPPVRAVVLAAGYQPHLKALLRDAPKSLLEIKGRTILARQLETLAACGVAQVSVVRGFGKERIQLPTLRTYDNDRYESTGELYSLGCAAKELTGRVLCLYGDIVFDRAVIQRLLEAPGDVTLVVDRSWRDEPPGSRAAEAAPDLVVEKDSRPAGRRFVPSAAPIDVVRVGGRIPAAEAHSEFIGILLLSEKGSKVVRETLDELVAKGWDRPLQESPSLERAGLTDLLQELIARGQPVQAVETYKGWIEIDSFEDYQRAWSMLS